MGNMTYEEYLDEVTTLIVEKYNADDGAAIKMVMQAQDAEFFVQHDEQESLRNVDQAHKDAKSIFTSASKPKSKR
jgi:ABC-type molybdate transport system ATPase subunit